MFTLPMMNPPIAAPSSPHQHIKRSYKQDFLQNQIEEINRKMEALISSPYRSDKQVERMMDMQKSKQALERELKKLKGTQLRQQRFRDKKKRTIRENSSQASDSPYSSPSSSYQVSPVQTQRIISSSSPSSPFFLTAPAPQTTRTSFIQPVPAPGAAAAQKHSFADVESWLCGSEQDFLMFSQAVLPSFPNAESLLKFQKFIQLRQQFLNDSQEYDAQTAKALFRLSFVASRGSSPSIFQ
jgi:hypothetical protein